ncbi:MAG: hypothetical protein GHHEDOFH_01558 [Pseudorhodoplanes sp.]|nr:hypothetical protein [Pseudorhodoplanes sp.]
MKITIEISDDTAMYVGRLVDLANQSEFNSDGQLTIGSLAEMLLNDCALVIRRPGCWEAANMHSLLTSHGYEV